MTDPWDTLAFRDVVYDLLRRISLLSHACGDGPVHARHEELAMTDAAAGVQIADAALRWVDVPRFFRNQRQAITFGGQMGWARYDVEPAPWLPLLRAGELLHVGKHTTFGFGAIEIS